MNSRAWFQRFKAWGGRTYYWPRRWHGALLMIAAVALALTSMLLVTSLARSLKHPALGWLSLPIIIAIYAGFGRIAEHRARD